MNILFIEYKVNENDEEMYVAKMKQALKQVERVEWLASYEQKHQYVEIWHLDSKEQLEQFRHERTQQSDSFWRSFDRYIVGGPEKMKAWPFQVLK